MSKIPFNDTFHKQQAKLVRATFKKAIITNVNTSSNTADVYFAQDPSTVIRSIPLASQIDVSQVMVGDRCRVDVFDESNPNDMVVAYIYGRVLSFSKKPVFAFGYFFKSNGTGLTDIIPHTLKDSKGNAVVPSVYGITNGQVSAADFASGAMYLNGAADTVDIKVIVTTTSISFDCFWFAIYFPS